MFTLSKVLGSYSLRVLHSLRRLWHVVPSQMTPKRPMAHFALLVGTFSLMSDNATDKMKSELADEKRKLILEYGQTTVYPEPIIDLKTNTYQVIFDIDQRKCDMLALMMGFIAAYNDDKDKDFTVVGLRTFTKNDFSTTVLEFIEREPSFKSQSKGTITITGVNNNERANFKFIFEKDNDITPRNHKGLRNCYREAVKPKAVYFEPKAEGKLDPKGGIVKQAKNLLTDNKKAQKATIDKLKGFGVQVFDGEEKDNNIDWDYLAGYQHQKRQIEDTVLLALTYPQIYDDITMHTRMKFEANRPKAVLFEGPPGTGKTTSAKIISQQVKIPLIYMPIEAIMSKFYGESEQKLADMWQLCRSLGKVIIFIDEIDALAVNRGSQIHEASRRILSTLLRKIDSFESTTDVLLICATNRKRDLDPAMLSRIDLSVVFNLPDKPSRAAIFQRYAKHLSQEQLSMLAEKTMNFSGRNICDICKNAERRWASKLIRKQTEEKLPPLSEYVESLNERRDNQLA